MLKISADYVFQAVLETVAKITHEKGNKNDTQETKYVNVKIVFRWLCGGKILNFEWNKICYLFAADL